MLDPGEAGLAGWTIFIDEDQDGVLDVNERWVVTDANGLFTFYGVPVTLMGGTLWIEEVQQPGYTQTTGSHETVVLPSAGGSVGGVQIGNFTDAPGLTVTKTADVASVDAAGDVITYTIAVQNVGNVGLTGVTIDDPLLADEAYVSGHVDNDGVLDAFERWHYGNTTNGAASDTDADGATLATEYRWGSDPTVAGQNLTYGHLLCAWLFKFVVAAHHPNRCSDPW